MAKVLITELHADVNAQDADGASALHYAAANGQIDLLTCLLQHGANPTVADESGETAAQAVREADGVTPQVIELLEQACSKNSKKD